MRSLLSSVIIGVLVWGCGASSGGTTATATDTSSDASTADLGSLPSDTNAADATTQDTAQDTVSSDAGTDTASGDAAGSKATAWGPISGACGVLSAEWASAQPSFYVTTWNFDQAGPFDPKPLRAGAQARYSGPNAGGSSKCSEVMSMQLLYECEGATTLKTEVEISYTVQGGITDWLATVAGHKIGVSVTRAYKGPTIQTYTESDATTLLQKKLSGVLESTANVAPADKWQKQVVHIWTLHADWVPTLQAAWQKLDAATKADTIVLVTVESGSTDITADTCQ